MTPPWSTRALNSLLRFLSRYCVLALLVYLVNGTVVKAQSTSSLNHNGSLFTLPLEAVLSISVQGQGSKCDGKESIEVRSLRNVRRLAYQIGLNDFGKGLLFIDGWDIGEFSHYDLLQYLRFYTSSCAKLEVYSRYPPAPLPRSLVQRIFNVSLQNCHSSFSPRLGRASPRPSHGGQQ